MAADKSLAVFVHGFGSSAECWTPLLKLFRGDPVIHDRFDLQCYQYPTAWFSVNPLKRIPRLEEVARGLAEYLDLCREYREITLIGHSQGGLVIQNYLADRVAKDVHDLRRIRQAILIATPSLGSTTASGLRNLVSRVFPNPQERILRVFDPEIAAMHEVIKNKIFDAEIPENASERRDSWPIPIQCFWGNQDNVVSRASACAYYDNVGPLEGDHFTILQPENTSDLRYRLIADALLEPAGHRNVHEVELYETRVEVRPLPAGSVYEVKHGERSERISCDNVARVSRTVQFARKNRYVSPFVTKYGTTGRGFVSGQCSHPNQWTSTEQGDFEYHGKKFVFRFSPQPHTTFSMDVDVYAGFDDGNRDFHSHLGTSAYYHKVAYEVDLSRYARAGWHITPPKLYFHAQDVGHGHLCADRRRDNAVAPSLQSPEGLWRWEIQDVREGVVDLVWNVTEPASVATATKL